MDISTDTILVSAPLTETLTWELNEGGVLRVFGEGAMPDWNRDALDTRPWEPMRDRIREVHAENGVTRIGARSFCGYENLEAVSLPETVSTVSYHAFFDCRKLEEVTVPGEVSYRFFYEKTIPENTSDPKNSVKSAGITRPFRSAAPSRYSTAASDTPRDPSEDIPFGSDAPHTILLGLHAFARTPWGIRTFGEFVTRGDVLVAYMGCGESVDIPPVIRRIHDFAFAGLPVTEVFLPCSVQEIGAFAFNDTRLRLVKIPHTICRVENGAFSNIAEFEGAVFPRANMTKVYFHPRAFLGSARKPPVLSPGRNRRFHIRQTPLPHKPGILELQLAAKEKYVGVDMVRMDLTMEQLLRDRMTLVQILYDPEAKEILQVAGVRGLYQWYRSRSTKCGMIEITASGEYRLKTCEDKLVSYLFGRRDPEPILSHRRCLAVYHPFTFTPSRSRHEAWLACPQKENDMESEMFSDIFLSELKRGLFAWQDLHPEYHLCQEKEF